MANDDDKPMAVTPLASNSKPSPNPKKDQSPVVVSSQTSSSHPKDNGNFDSSVPDVSPNSKREFISSVAAKIAAQPLQDSDRNVWGVLTAISDMARKRQQVKLLQLFWETPHFKNSKYLSCTFTVYYECFP